MEPLEGRSRFGDPHQKEAPGLHKYQTRYFDKSMTNRDRHLCGINMDDFPEDFLDDPMPMAPPPKDPGPSLILSRYPIDPDIDVIFIEPKKKKKIALPIKQRGNQSVSSAPTQQGEICVNWAIKRKRENVISSNPPAKNQLTPASQPTRYNQSTGTYQSIVTKQLNSTNQPTSTNQLVNMLKTPQNSSDSNKVEGRKVTLPRLLFPVKKFGTQKRMQGVAEVRTPFSDKTENARIPNEACSTQPYFVSTSSGESSPPLFDSSSDPLNAPIDENTPVDTHEVCEYVKFELKRLKIPQLIFAERVLGRTQGTLSDLLRNPKPWAEMKSGKQTLTRMFNWAALPLKRKLELIGMNEDGEIIENFSGVSSPPVAVAKRNFQSPFRNRASDQKATHRLHQSSERHYESIVREDERTDSSDARRSRPESWNRSLVRGQLLHERSSSQPLPSFQRSHQTRNPGRR